MGATIMPTQGPSVNETIVVVGSGVIGLTCALILARRGLRVVIIARDLVADDPSQDWSSPWAGANWCPFGTDPKICRWETEGFARLHELVPAGLAMDLPIKRFASTEAGLHNHWYRNVVNDYRHLPSDQCPPGSVGVAFTSLSVNAPDYCKWLHAQCSALGVDFIRRELRSLEEVVGPDTKIIINATGLGARWLEDVRDENVEPIRGQIVLVKAPAVRTCTMDATLTTSEPTRSTYVIPRPNSGGQVICGGCYEVGSLKREVDLDLSRDILQKCLDLHPELAEKNGGVDSIKVIRHCVGFRPSRRGGPRLEMEALSCQHKKYFVIHAYGIGPAGYQASWGMASDACDLVDQALRRPLDGCDSGSI
ncbi:D-amino acid oxidase in complex with Two Anthranylate molecules [Naematelia encephala]|uniref:D-amino acid oxidase in complex with Two Anthranylate molecules n=1 Tax=Naematelia encephala TaxID=71784 RepID=A0A1Y2AJ18_9TREE|nr:D-amino acid oxidase in complex with Two Anthranylate molecules [Naematelia encephala]